MDNTIYIIMIDEKPYGYFKNEEEIESQISNAKKYTIPQFDLNKFFYWHEMTPSDEDTISKWKCVSIDKNDFMRYEQFECILEVIKVSLIEPLDDVYEECEN